MILTVLPVPPPPVGPSIAVDGGAMRSEDDLTHKLGDINASANANVRRCEPQGAPAHVISEFEQLLQVCNDTGLYRFEVYLCANFGISSMWLHTWTTTPRATCKPCRSPAVLRMPSVHDQGEGRVVWGVTSWKARRFLGAYGHYR